MKDRAALLLAERNRGTKCSLDRVDGVILRDDAVRIVLDHLLDQRRKILIIVVERIPVDAALFDDHLHGDGRHRQFFEKVHEGLLDGIFHETRHKRHCSFPSPIILHTDLRGIMCAY